MYATRNIEMHNGILEFRGKGTMTSCIGYRGKILLPFKLFHESMRRYSLFNTASVSIASDGNSDKKQGLIMVCKISKKKNSN